MPATTGDRGSVGWPRHPLPQDRACSADAPVNNRAWIDVDPTPQFGLPRDVAFNVCAEDLRNALEEVLGREGVRVELFQIVQ